MRPPLLFAPIAGAVTDRHNRLRIVVLVNLARVGKPAVLVLAIVTGQGSIGVVLTALFVLSTAEVFADTSRFLEPCRQAHAPPGRAGSGSN